MFVSGERRRFSSSDVRKLQEGSSNSLKETDVPVERRFPFFMRDRPFSQTFDLFMFSEIMRRMHF